MSPLRRTVALLVLISVAGNLAGGATIALPSSGERRPAATCPSPDPNLNHRPVIGIVSHPGDGASGRLSNATNASNIPASYVKFVESAGARVVPLIYDQHVIFEKLNLVNGVLFTGGWAKEGLYFETIKKVFELALKRNDAGEHFPIFAICLGFELISMIVSKDNDILERFAGKDQASTLHFFDCDITGSVFERFPSDLLSKLSTDCLALQNHMFGVSPKRLQENVALSSFFKILTTTKDDDGQDYISTARAYNYPVTGFQWHPEKNAFEWAQAQKIPHTEDAIRVTQHIANYFISEARKSFNKPPTQKVLDNLIYNYKPTYGGKAGKGYDEVYIFE